MKEEKLNTIPEFPEKGLIFLIDKDYEWTSFNVVKKVKVKLLNKYKIKKLKVGHAGTLDPLATGLVVVCAGKETKNIEKYQLGEKEYLAKIRIGATTPSYDLETEIDERFDYEHITSEDVIKALKSFEGEQMQQPPLFSAKNIGGKRAYEFARKGHKMELESRLVFFRELELLDFNSPYIEVRIVCGKGTYIRSLAFDLGKKLNYGAHLVGLRRTKVGEFRVEEAVKASEFNVKIRS